MDTESPKPDETDLRYKPNIRRDLIAEWIFDRGGLKNYRPIKPQDIVDAFSVSYSTAKSDLRHPRIAEKTVELIRAAAGSVGLSRAWEVMFNCLNCGIPAVQLSAAKYIITNGGVFADADAGDAETEFEKLVAIITGNGEMDGAYSEN